MNLEELQDFKFYLSLSFVIVLSSILTIITVEIIKLILKKKKIITEETDADKKDQLLIKIGRFVALLIYTIVYLIKEFLLKHDLIFNEALFIGLLSGGAVTLTVAKGLYTSFRQSQKKKKVFDKLTEAESKLEALQKEALEKQTKIILTRKERN